MISKNNYNRIGNIILFLELKLLSEYNGKKCSKCGLIQGLPNDKLGVKVWYCGWVYKKVNKKLKKIKERATKSILICKLEELKSRIGGEDEIQRY